MGRDTPEDVVMNDLLNDVTVVVGTGSVRDSCKENRRSRYVVLKGIPEAEWLIHGLTKLKGGNGASGWGRRDPVVVGRVSRAGAVKVSVTVEVSTGEAVAAMDKGGVVVMGI